MGLFRNKKELQPGACGLMADCVKQRRGTFFCGLGRSCWKGRAPWRKLGARSVVTSSAELWQPPIGWAVTGPEGISPSAGTGRWVSSCGVSMCLEWRGYDISAGLWTPLSVKLFINCHHSWVCSLNTDSFSKLSWIKWRWTNILKWTRTFLALGPLGFLSLGLNCPPLSAWLVLFCHSAFSGDVKANPDHRIHRSDQSSSRVTPFLSLFSQSTSCVWHVLVLFWLTCLLLVCHR